MSSDPHTSINRLICEPIDDHTSVRLPPPVQSTTAHATAKLLCDACLQLVAVFLFTFSSRTLWRISIAIIGLRSLADMQKQSKKSGKSEDLLAHLPPEALFRFLRVLPASYKMPAHLRILGVCAIFGDTENVSKTFRYGTAVSLRQVEGHMVMFPSRRDRTRLVSR